MPSMLGAVARLTSAPMAIAPVPAPLRVHVTGAEANLGTRVLALLADSPAVTEGSATACDVVVHLGAGDHDLRARRRESVTEGAAAMLDDATVGQASHVVFVSSAMVYGAYANNPIPLTEDAILRPDVEFVYARQLATVEAMVDRWRRAAPGRHGHRPAAGGGDGRRRNLITRGRVRRRDSGSASTRTTLLPSSSTSTIWLRRWRSPPSNASMVCSTWRPMAGWPASACGR